MWLRVRRVASNDIVNIFPAEPANGNWDGGEVDEKRDHGVFVDGAEHRGNAALGYAEDELHSKPYYWDHKLFGISALHFHPWLRGCSPEEVRP
jgi:hypothetical protein